MKERNRLISLSFRLKDDRRPVLVTENEGEGVGVFKTYSVVCKMRWKKRKKFKAVEYEELVGMKKKRERQTHNSLKTFKRRGQEKMLEFESSERNEKKTVSANIQLLFLLNNRTQCHIKHRVTVKNSMKGIGIQ